MEDSASSVIHALRTQLPVTRVRKIFRLDSNCMAISAEAVQLLTLATERFIGLLAKIAYGQAVFDKRKTLQLRDLEFCVKNYEPFNFLDGTLDGWPEINGEKRSLGNESGMAMAAKMSGGFFSLDADTDAEQGDLNVDGLNDEIFGFDESLEEIEPPFDGQITEKLDDAVTAKNAGMLADVVPERQGLKLEVFGHYGYYRPMNSFLAVPIETADVEIEADMTRTKQREVEMEIDTSEQYDSSNMTGFELATDNVEVSPNIQPFNNQDISQPLEMSHSG
ncbi:hypothetical protein LOAG_07058 [Loa loa]|uniref:CBFD_NFYB_HMF domain-containing protein n=1 Tax=Loa loa TaxID=7209 RepID=A0A1I7V5Z1_LOALO|nr:hypothetical protein LOAG_07058 [Loa loa]EFO21432.1 hypothetical protein LOAG_07058 [Loa loa]